MVGKPSEPRVRILFGEAVALGPGKADLLQAIDDTGSITRAARAMGMSYRRAWLLIDNMNRDFREALVDTARGGAGGGGARLTPTGSEVLRRYREMEATAAKALAPEIAEFRRLLARDA